MGIIRRLLYSPFNVQLVVTRRCNLACRYCNEYDSKAMPVPLEDLKKRVDKLRELGALSIVFTGGEPLTHPGIFELIDYSKKRIFRVGLITNGFLIDKDKIEKLKNLDYMQISVDGTKPNKNTKKVLKYLRRNILLIKKLGKFKLNVNIVIGACSRKEVFGIVNFCNKNNIYSTFGLLHDDNGQVILDGEGKKTFFEANKIRKRPFWDIGRFEKRLLGKGDSDFKCRAGSRYLYVDELGLVHWCSQRRYAYSCPLEEINFEELKKQFYKLKNCSQACTIGCVRKASALDFFRKVKQP